MLDIFNTFENFQNIDLLPNMPENVDIELAIKNNLLFSSFQNKIYAFTYKEKLVDALNYHNKLDINVDLALLDQPSYEKLYHRYHEIKTDRALSINLGNNKPDDLIDNDEAIEDFLRIGVDILTSEESAPIIKFVNSLFYHAIKKEASDIHIETHENKSLIRFRIDGVMTKHLEIDNKVTSLVISRIKIISNLDISEKRLPQDGRTRIKIAGKNLDIRISILPMYNGEKVVMRILMESAQIPSMQELGFSKELTNHFINLLKHSHGMILVTGPTGSGKSTTLHTFIQTIATEEKNITTIEDPVEYQAANINQMQVNSKIGFSFSSGLRSILRQDPDVIMVGEIRDGETAKIAIQAALTGHLVLSTLHTNNTTATITRLVDMGIEEYLISSCLLGVLSQRLVRKLCPHCKCEELLNLQTYEEFALDPKKIYFKAVGCNQCNFTGYYGRQAIGELFIMTEEIKTLIKQNFNDFEIRQRMEKNGMKLLSTNLLELLNLGVTSLSEAIRVGIKEN